MKAKKRIKLAISILLLMFLLINIDVAYSSSVQIHPPWGEDGNELYIKAFGKDRYLIVKTRTSAAINAAIDALGAEGGEIYLPEGTYAITTKVQYDADNTTIRGSGKGTILQMGASNDYMIYADSKNNIVFRDLTIDCATLDFTELTADPVRFDGSRILVENVFFKNHHDEALFILNDLSEAAETYNLVNKCFFEDGDGADSVALWIHGGSNECKTIVTDCQFEDCVRGIFVEEGVAIIKGCTFEDLSDYAIYAYSGVAIGPEYSVVSNCFFNNGTAGDIYVAQDNWIISNNVFKNSDHISFSSGGNYHVVKGNIFSLPTDIAFGQVNIAGHYWVVSGNIFEVEANDADWHISFNSGDYCIITHNEFDTDVDTAAIYMDSSDTSNIIYGNQNTSFDGANRVYGDFEVYAYSRSLGRIRSLKTDSYTITTEDFGKTFVMSSADDKTFTLPSVGADEDGAQLFIEKMGAGKLTIDAADTDYVHTSGAGDGIFNAAGQSYASVEIEYNHTDTRWYVKHGMGAWVPYD